MSKYVKLDAALKIMEYQKEHEHNLYKDIVRDGKTFSSEIHLQRSKTYCYAASLISALPTIEIEESEL